MGFPRQEYWSGLPFLSPGCLPVLGIKPMSPHCSKFFTIWASREVPVEYCSAIKKCNNAIWSNVGRRQWQNTPVLLPGKSHERRSLVGCSPWGCCESDTTERLRFQFSPSCTGEGNGNPLQCSCLEIPREQRFPGAAVYGVTQSRTLLKWFSSSSSRDNHTKWNESDEDKFIWYHLHMESKTMRQVNLFTKQK